MPNELEATATARLIFDASSLRQGTRDAQQALGSLYEVVRDNWWGIRNVGIAFAATGAAIASGVAVAVKAAADFEQGMAGVARTSYEAQKAGESQAEAMERNAAAAAQIGDELRRIAQTRPVDLGTITQLAEEAGALGIPGRSVAAFTETIADLVATTNLTAEAAPKLARLAGVYGLTAEQYKNLGAAIFETGRSTAATETEILNMATRLAGAGKAAGLTADQVVALSAATLSLGPRAEAAASALQRTMGDFAAAAADADPTALENFAIVADTTAKRFKELIRNNPGQALTEFITGLGEMGTDAVAAQETLRNLGITEVRQIQALQALAAGTKNTANENVNLKKTFELSNKAFQDGTAVTDAAQRQYQTLSNQLIILQNNVHEVFLSFGTLFLPVVKEGVVVAKDFAVGLAALPPGLKGVAAGITTAVGGISLLAAGFLLLGPRVVLAQDAFAKLTSSMRVSIGTAATLAAAENGAAEATGRSAFAAGLKAKEMARATAAEGAHTAATLLDAEAQLAEARAAQLSARIAAERILLIDAETAGLRTKAAAIGANIAAMEAELVMAQASARAALANAAAQRVSTTAMGTGTVAAYGLGAALRFMTGPIGLIITALTVAAGAVAFFGRETEQARNAAEAYTAVDQELVSALQQEAAGHVGAVNAVIAHRLAMTGAIAIARQYGIDIQVLMATIRGETAATSQFIAAIRGAYANGEAGAQQLAHQVQGLAESYSASVKAARDQQAAIGNAGDASGDAAKRFKELANNSKEAKDALKDQAQAANDLVGAMISLEDAAIAVKDAQIALDDAQKDVANKADRIAKAEIDLANARASHAQNLRDIKDAEEAVATARERAQAIVTDAENDLADAQDRRIDATLKVRDAEEALAKLNAGPTLKELRDATNKLANARLDLNKSNKLASDSEWYLNYLMGEGASSRDIQDATDSLTEARQEQLNDTASVIDAETELQDVVNGASAEELAKAERDLAKARRDSKDASEDVLQAEKDLATARTDQRNDTLRVEAERDLAAARRAAIGSAIDIKDAEQDLKDARKNTDATRAVTRAERGLTAALYRQAQAMVAVKKAQAIAAGREFTAADEARAMSKALKELGRQASGPVRRQLLQYARTIDKNIPKEIKTNLGISMGGGTGIGSGFGGGNIGKIPGGKLLPDLIDSYDKRLDDFKDDHKSFWGRLFSKEGWEDSLEGWYLLERWITNELPGKIGPALSTAWDGITEFSKDFAGQYWDELSQNFAQLAPTVADVGEWFQGLWDGITGWFTDLFDELWWHSIIPDGLNAIIQGFVDFPGDLIAAVGDSIKDGIASLFDFGGGGGILDSMKNVFTTAGSNTWQWFKDGVGATWDLVGFVAGKVSGAAGGVWQNFQNLFGGAADKAWEAFQSSANAGWNLTAMIASKLDGWREDAWGRFRTFFGNMADRAWEEFQSSARAGWNFVATLGARIDGWRDDAFAKIRTFGENIGTRMWTGLQAGIRDAADGFAGWFSRFLKGKGLTSIARGVFGGVAAALKAPFNVVISGFNAALRSIGNIGFKIPSWVPKIGGNSWSFPDYKISYLAEGGILNKPVFAAGEAGAEVVMPLDKLLNMFAPVETLVLQLEATNAALSALIAGSGGDSSTLTNNYNDDVDIHVYDKTSPAEIADELHWRRVTRR